MIKDILAGKIALVTGAARGIGKSVALALAEAGSTVIVNYNGSKERAMEVTKAIEEMGGTAESYQCNVADFKACGDMISDIIKKYGRIDILVNNAGITRDNLIIGMREEEYDDVINTNLKGAFNTIRHISKSFLKQKSGKIVNISSVSGLMGNPGQSNYAASKAGIVGLTKSVAKELGSRGICVNAVAPGFIKTDMTEKLDEGVLNKAVENIPIKRLGEPKDVANIVVFLASSLSDYITGEVIRVDGGMAM